MNFFKTRNQATTGAGIPFPFLYIKIGEIMAKMNNPSMHKYPNSPGINLAEGPPFE